MKILSVVERVEGTLCGWEGVQNHEWERCPHHWSIFVSLKSSLILSALFLVEHRYPAGFASLLVLHASFGQFLVDCRARVFERLVKVSWRFSRTRVFGGRYTIKDLEIPSRLPHWIYERFSKGFFHSPHHAPAIYSVSVANQLFLYLIVQKSIIKKSVLQQIFQPFRLRFISFRILHTRFLNEIRGLNFMSKMIDKMCGRVENLNKRGEFSESGIFAYIYLKAIKVTGFNKKKSGCMILFL